MTIGINSMRLLPLILIIFLIFALPVHAYAGPGMAIGAVIIAITVIVAFVSSAILRLIPAFKAVGKKANRSIRNKDRRKANKNK